jgi:hypothetical protein
MNKKTGYRNAPPQIAEAIRNATVIDDFLPPPRGTDPSRRNSQSHHLADSEKRGFLQNIGGETRRTVSDDDSQSSRFILAAIRPKVASLKKSDRGMMQFRFFGTASKPHKFKSRLSEISHDWISHVSLAPTGYIGIAALRRYPKNESEERLYCLLV